jgi:hypothetical protein
VNITNQMRFMATALPPVIGRIGLSDQPDVRIAGERTGAKMRRAPVGV